MKYLRDLVATRSPDIAVSLTAVCSAHPLVLRSALRYGCQTGNAVLIEATCNQVNHQGGYTGTQPHEFVAEVKRLAQLEGLPTSDLLLGGDHLGPNPWRHLPAADAMAEAELMVAAFAEAGFHKFHLDASMSCADDPPRLAEEEIAQRAARMATVVESRATCEDPVYVIGTEVPPPGGANHVLDDVPPTDPAAALATIETHRKIFHSLDLHDAFERVIAVVVQPGVEFGDSNVYQYKPEAARGLAKVLEAEPSIAFEAHSTDYQLRSCLHQLGVDGYRIQKVGPWLTFALREALYALDNIAACLHKEYTQGALPSAMEAVMTARPEHWQDHYCGSDTEQQTQRHFSYSDRIRYYWNTPEASAAVAQLMQTLEHTVIPETLVSQYLPALWRDAMAKPASAEGLVLDTIERVLTHYPLPVVAARTRSRTR